MDFSDKELKVLLQSLYRLRGEVSGASQSEQNRLELVVSVIDKIESKVGPIKSERTRVDRDMDESLSVLKTGKMGLAKSTKEKSELDNEGATPKVINGASNVSKSAATTKAKKPASASTKAEKASGPAKPAASTTRSK